MIRRRKNKRMGVKEAPPSYPAHLKWIRGNECCVALHSTLCLGKMHAHHVKTKGAGGLDNQTVPLCNFHHGELHTTGRDTFEGKYGVNLANLAEDYARISPHRKKWSLQTTKKTKG
tara:strand:- start:643 stop:990 length:348 start_codon:yes stop_codon:yes gene_type:complete